MGGRKCLKIIVLSSVLVPFSCPAPAMLVARHVSHVTTIFSEKTSSRKDFHILKFEVASVEKQILTLNPPAKESSLLPRSSLSRVLLNHGWPKQDNTVTPST